MRCSTPTHARLPTRMPDTYQDFCCAATEQLKLCKEAERCWVRCPIGPTRTTPRNFNRVTSCYSQLTASRKPRTPNSKSSATSACWKPLAHATEARWEFNAPSCSMSRPSAVEISATTQRYLFYESLERCRHFYACNLPRCRGMAARGFTEHRPCADSRLSQVTAARNVASCHGKTANTEASCWNQPFLRMTPFLKGEPPTFRSWAPRGLFLCLRDTVQPLEDQPHPLTGLVYAPVG